jgi:hypothetical protein
MTFNITIQPTPEVVTFTINGAKVPLRVWVGRTDAGTPLDAYVLSIVPEKPYTLDSEVPEFMRRSRDTFNIDTSPGSSTSNLQDKEH